jgi:hypothetical protein
MQGQVDPDYLAAASYLAEVGFTNKTEIARVLDVAMNPNSLFVTASVNANARPLTVDADMRPVVDFLQSRGVSVGDTVKVRAVKVELCCVVGIALLCSWHRIVCQICIVRGEAHMRTSQ